MNDITVEDEIKIIHDIQDDKEMFDAQMISNLKEQIADLEEEQRMILDDWDYKCGNPWHDQPEEKVELAKEILMGQAPNQEDEVVVWKFTRPDRTVGYSDTKPRWNDYKIEPLYAPARKSDDRLKEALEECNRLSEEYIEGNNNDPWDTITKIVSIVGQALNSEEVSDGS